jgi:hypothetical protein
MGGGYGELPALQVPRQCPLFLLAKVVWTGHVLGSEEGEAAGSGPFISRGNKLSRVCTELVRNFYINVGRGTFV